MNRFAFCLLLAAVLFSAGCETTESKRNAMPDSAVAIVAASEEQLLLGKNRAEAIASRWSAEERAKFTKGASPLLAVRTLSLTPEQSAAAGAQVPQDGSALCVVLWNAKEEKVVGSQVYVVTTPPEKNEPARFSSHVARYVGSL
jgi:hypothetical protein